MCVMLRKCIYKAVFFQGKGCRLISGPKVFNAIMPLYEFGQSGSALYLPSCASVCNGAGS